MKILHIIGNLETGGAEKLLLDSLPLLNKRDDITADVLVFDGKKTPFFELLRARGVLIRHLGKGLYNPIFIFKLIPYLKEYDIVHVHLFPAQYFVVFAKIISLSKTKLFFTEHSTDNSRMNQPLFRPIDRFFYRFYIQIICITEQVREALIKKLKISSEKLVVLNNGVDIQKIENAEPYERTAYRFNNNDKLIIMVAGFRLEKDQLTVIKAMAKLPKNYKLILVGDGRTRSVSEDLTQALKLEEQVSFYGVRTDVYALMKMCDIAVLSSHWEGFGLSAIESMACKLPTIVTNVPGLAETVGDAAVTFETGNVEQLVVLIRNIFDDRVLFDQLAQRGFDRARQFKISSMIDRQVMLYKRMFV